MMTHKLRVHAMLVVALCCVGMQNATANIVPRSRPNILWVITDDHRSDSLTCYNLATSSKQESKLGHVQSPNIDRLATEGVLFTNAYCNSPGCAPSRSSMHTGKYPHRNGMYGFRQAHQAADCSSRMIPEVMKEHGYQPSHFGKSGYYIFSYEEYSRWADPGYYQPFVSRKSLQQSDGSDFWFNKPWGKVNGKGMVVGTEEVFRFEDGSVKRFWRTREDREITNKEKALRKQVEEQLDILRSYTRRNPSLIIGGVSSNSTWNTLDGATVKSMQHYLANEGRRLLAHFGRIRNGSQP